MKKLDSEDISQRLMALMKEYGYLPEQIKVEFKATANSFDTIGINAVFSVNKPDTVSCLIEKEDIKPNNWHTFREGDDYE